MNNNLIGTNLDGTPNMKYNLNKNASYQVDKSTITTSQIRNGAAQQYRNNSKSQYKDQKEVCHVVDLEIITELSKTTKGSLSQKVLNDIKKYANQDYNLQMRLKETNRVSDPKSAQKIQDLIKGDQNVKLNQQECQKVKQQIDAFDNMIAQAKKEQNYDTANQLQSYNNKMQEIYEQQTNHEYVE